MQIRLIADANLQAIAEGHVAGIGGYSIAGISNPIIDVTGTWTADMTPNDQIAPAGTVWQITERVAGQRPVVFYIIVPTNGGEAQDMLASPPGDLPSSALNVEIANRIEADEALAALIAGGVSGGTP